MWDTVLFSQALITTSLFVKCDNCVLLIFLLILPIQFEPWRTIIAIRILLVANLSRYTVVVLNHVCRFFNQEILRLPEPCFPFIFSYKISCKIRYLWLFLIICIKYSSLDVFIVNSSSLSYLIFVNTCWLVTWPLQSILNICWFILHFKSRSI